jgi:hypothetical protein
MPRKKLIDESNFRGDLKEKEEITIPNKALEEASREEEIDLTPSHWKVTPDKRTTKMAGGLIDPTEWNLGNIPEPEVLDDGDEVEVTISSVTDAETRNGGIPYWRIMLEVADRPLVKPFPYNLYKPHEGQTPRQDFDTKYTIQHFMKACSMSMDRKFDPEMDWLGETGWCIVNMREDREYGKQNSVRKWILPK